MHHLYNVMNVSCVNKSSTEILHEIATNFIWNNIPGSIAEQMHMNLKSRLEKRLNLYLQSAPK